MIIDNQDPVLTTVAAYVAHADEFVGKTHELSFFPGLQDWLDQFIMRLPGKKVLDVGFGAGRDTLYLHSKGLEVAGIELADIFIDALRQRIDIPLFKMDMRHLDFADNSFDGIWSCASFLHLPKEDALPTLVGFARALRPGGILYIDLKEGVGSKWDLNERANISKAYRYFTYYQTEEFVALLKQAGLEVLLTGKKNSVRPDRPLWLHFLASKPSLS